LNCGRRNEIPRNQTGNPLAGGPDHRTYLARTPASGETAYNHAYEPPVAARRDITRRRDGQAQAHIKDNDMTDDDKKTIPGDLKIRPGLTVSPEGKRVFKIDILKDEMVIGEIRGDHPCGQVVLGRIRMDHQCPPWMSRAICFQKETLEFILQVMKDFHSLKAVFQRTTEKEQEQ
jgi:hypothetical protein